MRTIQIDVNHLRAVSLFSAVKDIRFYLNGVCVEVTPSAVRLSATNGHMLAVTNTPHDNHDPVEGEPAAAPVCGQWIIPSAAVKAGLKCASRALSVLTLTVPDEGYAGCTLGLPGNAVVFDAIEGRFPDVRRVVPTTSSGEPAQYNPDYLVAFQRAAECYCRKGASRWITVGYNGQAAALVNIGEESFVGVIMPTRNSDKPSLPDWWDERAPEQPEEMREAA